MNIKIITVGAKPSKPLSTMLDDYLTRLPRSINLSWHYIKHGNGSTSTSKQQEAESILRQVPDDYFTILLDETGNQYSSEKLSDLIFNQHKNVVFVIGGAYGVSERIVNRADLVLGLSKLVFPHQIVRLVLAEQIYRSYTISINHPYHHT